MFTVSDLFLRASNFLVLPLITSELSKDDYSLFSFVITYLMLSILFTVISLNTYLLKELPKEKNHNNISSTCYSFLLLTGLIMLVVDYFAIGYIINAFFDNIEAREMIYVSIVLSSAKFIDVLTVVPTCLLRVKRKVGVLALGSLMKGALYISVVFYLKNNNLLTLESLSLSYLMTSLILCIVFHISEYSSIRIKLRIDVLKRALKFSILVLPNALMFYAASYLDRFFVMSYLGATEFAIFSVAASIAAIVQIVANSIYKSVEPELLSGNNVKRVTRIYITLVTMVYITSILSISYIIEVFFDSRYFGAIFISKIIISAIYINALANLFVIEVYRLYSPSSVTFVAIACIVIGAIFNIILIPIYGIPGAAFSALIAMLTKLILLKATIKINENRI